MANRFKGEVGFTADGAQYVLVYTIDALIGLEDQFDCTVQQLGELLGDNLRIADLKAVFHAGLGEYHPDLDAAAAGRLMSVLGVAEAGALVGQAFGAAFAVGGSEAAKDGAPGPRKRAGTGKRAPASGLN